MADAQYSIDERLINAASNLLLTVFLAAIVRLAFGPGARTVSYYLLACAVALIFIQDTLVTLEVVGGPNATIGRALAPAIYVFFGAAAMHPDRHLMTEPPRQFDVSLSWRRITLLVGALLIAPAMICLQLALGWDPNIVILTISSILASMLVLARLIFLVRDREQATVREQTLREASARFAVAPDREAAYGAAMEAVERLASGATALRVVLVAEGPEDLQILHVAGYRASEAVGCVRREALHPDVAAALGQRDVADLVVPPVVLDGDDTPRPLLVIPLASQRAVRTAMLVSTDNPLPAITRRAIVTLSTTLSLALEAAELSENLHRARSERRFRTLVENSSDLVLVVDDERRITFVSAASQRLLGLGEDELMHTDPFALLHDEDRPMAEATIDRRGPGRLHRSRSRSASATPTAPTAGSRSSPATCATTQDIAGIVINCREISDRKDAELQLFRSEARFRALVQGVERRRRHHRRRGPLHLREPGRHADARASAPRSSSGHRWTDLISADELEARA